MDKDTKNEIAQVVHEVVGLHMRALKKELVHMCVELLNQTYGDFAKIMEGQNEVTLKELRERARQAQGERHETTYEANERIRAQSR